MINGWLTLVGHEIFADVAVLTVLVSVASTMLRNIRLTEAALLFAWVVVDDVVALTPIAFKWNPGHWNWIGQTASLVLALGVVRWRFSPAEVGLRWPPNRAAWYWSLAGVIGALLIAVVPALTGPGSHPDLETFLYEATLPGPVEELVFRGVALAFLVRALSRRPDDRFASFLAAATTVVWFTSGHVIRVDDSGLHFVWARILDVMPMATLYVGVRIASRSLFGGIVAHNSANTLVETIAAIRF